MIILGRQFEKLRGKDLEGCFLGTIMEVGLSHVENMCIVGI